MGRRGEVERGQERIVVLTGPLLKWVSTMSVRARVTVAPWRADVGGGVEAVILSEIGGVGPRSAVGGCGISTISRSALRRMHLRAILAAQVQVRHGLGSLGSGCSIVREGRGRSRVLE